MGVRRGNAGRPVCHNVSSPIQDVDCIPFEMSALDQHSLRSERGDSCRRFLHRCKIAYRHAGQFPGFVQIGRDKKSLRQQKIRKGSSSLLRHKRLTVLADHHGINHERKFEILRLFSYKTDNLKIAERSRFCRCGRNVFQYCFQLSGNDIRRKDFHGAHFLCVLHRQQSDNTLAIDSPLVKCFQVRLDSRSSGWIRPCNSQSNKSLSISL